jgi:MoxR-like ATPase
MNTELSHLFRSIDAINEGLADLGYICCESIATSLYIACNLNKPVLIEGPPGVGKTELARVVSLYTNLPLIRLQCYEGLDESKALYEWKYGKQLLYIQLLREKLGDILEGVKGFSDSVARLHEFGDIFFSEEFLEPRPLLKSLGEPDGSILLIDEVDKSDHEFESLLLEIISEYQVSIPEIGTVRARTIPVVILTSNNTRELSDALKRRCIHLFIPFPETAHEMRIVESRVPGISKRLRTQLVSFIHRVRNLELKKKPAISETIDWARTLLLMNVDSLDRDLIQRTLNVILKFEDDISHVKAELGNITAGIC